MNTSNSEFFFSCRICFSLLLLTDTLEVNALEFIVNRTNDSIDALPGDERCEDTIDLGCSLRAAIMESNANPGLDSIVLSEGRYTLGINGQNENISESGDLDVTDALQVLGSGSSVTIIDAARIDRVLELHSNVSSNISIHGVTLRGGKFEPVNLEKPSGVGSHVNPGVHLVLSDVVVRENSSSAFNVALGIANWNSCITGSRVRVVDNNSSRSDQNFVSAVGGIYSSGSNSCLDFVDFEISRNAGDWAGAIYAELNATLNFRRALIADNQSRLETMIVDFGSIATLENTTISGNLGGATLLNDGNSKVNLINCTVTHNRSNGAGVASAFGGLVDVHSIPSQIRLRNTILDQNGPGSISDNCNQVTSMGGNLIGNAMGCEIHQLNKSDLIDVPSGVGVLQNLGGFTRARPPGGNAIDQGVEVGCPDVDQLQNRRPVDGDKNGQAACDIGAVEFIAERVTLHIDGFEN